MKTAYLEFCSLSKNDLINSNVLQIGTDRPNEIRKRLEKVDINSGNIVFDYAIRNIFECDNLSIASVDRDSLQEYDNFITADFIFIKEDTNMGWFKNIIEKVGDKPIIPLSIGLQAPYYKKEFHIEPETIEVIKLLEERGKLAVRGNYTAEILDKYGIRNIDVIGCPSAYLDLNSTLISNQKRKKDIRCVSNFRTLSNRADNAKDREILNYLARYTERYIEQTLCYFSPDIREGSMKEFMHFYMQNNRLFFDFKTWNKYMEKFDFSIGARFHGNMMAVLAGVPALFITCDSRTKEMTEYHGLPTISIDKFDINRPIEYYYEKADYSLFDKKRTENQKRFLEFCEKNGLHIKDIRNDVSKTKLENNEVKMKQQSNGGKRNIMNNISESEKEMYFLASIVAKNAHGRKIVLWGNSNELRRVLKKYFDLDVAFVITILKDIINGTSIRDFADMNGKNSEYYIVDWGRAYEKKYHDLLNDYGYKEIEDFVYRMIKPIIIENWNCADGVYEDQYGNHIEGSAGIIKKIILKGYNNRICIGENVSDLYNLEFEMCANSDIYIGNNCRFGGNTKLQINGYNGTSKIYIDKGCQFADSNFILYNHSACSSVIINEDSTFGLKLDIHANSGKKIVIGRDCMFSFDIQLQAGDGHSIFDVKTGKNVNSQYDESETIKNQIVIGEHVWVSSKSFILNGTNIGNGSIIGGNSTVKGVFPNNCVVAGNPAKKMKDDVAWTRDNCAVDIGRCGRKRYAVLTNDAKPALSGANVLVVGGTRFMGVQLVKELLARGNNVTIATRGNVKDYFGNRISRIIMDLEDQASVSSALQGKYFDVVFDNLAYCSKYVKNILDAVKCGKYIQLSSVEVYSPTKIDLKETDYNPMDIQQEWCGMDVGYQKGKRQAEATVFQKYPDISAVTVRVPYVTKTDRLLYYCRNIINDCAMNIDDTSRGFTFVRDVEVGKFLPWIAAQNYKGPINLASTGVVTIQQILDYIEKRTGKKAIIDTKKGAESPFHVFNEQSFSMNMDQAEKMGYATSEINEWFWRLIDEYIAQAMNERNVRQNEVTVSCVERAKCTGCGACLNICPTNAIVMCADKEGFLMPKIDTEKCIACGLCKKVCPTFEKNTYMKENVSCYALMAQDDIRAISSSGGAFTLLAEKVLEKGGAVCGAAWTEGYNVQHQMIEEKDRLMELRGSKYVQSNTGTTYSETKRLLDAGRLVLYTGTPCQIDGLLHYLQKDYENLITLDLLCRGIASNELFKQFVQENYKNLKLNRISFKDKKPLGWGATTSYELSDGSVEKTNIHNSIWMCAYLADIMDRRSCYSCKFNSSKRVGDISIGDFWGISEYNKNYNDSKGTSIVITSSRKGDALVNSVRSDCKLLVEVPLRHGVPYNSALCSHVKETPKRHTFFEVLNKMPFPAALDRTIYGKKYEVGIVGWWYNLNYGGTLTYFALNRAIQNLGYSVLMIRRSCSGPSMPNDNTVPMRFAKKHYNISRLYTMRDLHWVNYSCHAFVSGSDQLWNPYLEEYSGAEFFLSFVNQHNLTISYASSFGNIESIPYAYKEKYQPYLKRFDGISVREEYAVDICKRDFEVDAVQVCDPIFLCNAEVYKELEKDSKLQVPERYLLNFLLDPCKEKVDVYQYIQKSLNLTQNMNFTDLQEVKEKEKEFGGEKVYGNADIEDFVKAYVNADFVITDSFHGTCLAIIFNKPFISIANKKRGEKRFVSLMKWLNLEERLVFDVNEIYSRMDLLQKVDFAKANNIISESQSKGYGWLQSILKKMV